MPDIDDDATQFVVVHNDEEQYSIWPVDKNLPGRVVPRTTSVARSSAASITSTRYGRTCARRACGTRCPRRPADRYPTSCEVIMSVDGTPSGTLLVLDYPGRRPEGRIRDLDLEAAGWQVCHLADPPVRGAGSAAAYAQRLLERAGPFPDAVAVLAYCTGAAIAQEVAARLDALVPLVLFDGTPVTARLVARDFRAALMQVGWSPPPDLGAGVLEPDRLAAQPDDAVTWMREQLHSCAAAALRRDGVPEDRLAEFTSDIGGVYLDWLEFLVAAHNTDWPFWGGDVVHIVSDGHEPAADWPGAERTEVHRMQCTGVDLIRAPAVRPRVARLPRRVVPRRRRPMERMSS